MEAQDVSFISFFFSLSQLYSVYSLSPFFCSFCSACYSFHLSTFPKSNTKMARRNLSLGSDMDERMSYSRAVVSGSWVFVSGTTGHVLSFFPPTLTPSSSFKFLQLPIQASLSISQPHYSLSSKPFPSNNSLSTPSLDYSTEELVGPGIVEQTEQTLKTVETALNQDVVEMKDVVKVRYFLKDAQEFKDIAPVLKKYLGDESGGGGRPSGLMVQTPLLTEDRLRLLPRFLRRRED